MTIDPLSWVAARMARRPLRWLCRRLTPIAYQLGYSDGWEDSIGRRS